jgi:hypothetical protein
LTVRLWSVPVNAQDFGVTFGQYAMIYIFLPLVKTSLRSAEPADPKTGGLQT